MMWDWMILNLTALELTDRYLPGCIGFDLIAAFSLYTFIEIDQRETFPESLAELLRYFRFYLIQFCFRLYY